MSQYAALEAAIEAAWEARDTDYRRQTRGEAREAIEATLEALDKGALRVAEKRGADWHVNQWAKKAVLLGFRLKDMEIHQGGPQNGGLVGQGRQQVRRLGRKPLARCRLSAPCRTASCASRPMSPRAWC